MLPLTPQNLEWVEILMAQAPYFHDSPLETIKGCFNVQMIA